jgi:Lipopolysaccharide-assembly
MLRHSTICICLLTFVGCAAYHVGTQSLYAPDVTTVYLPMIESGSYRRDLGERLTEAVAKEIELKTPYKVVGTPAADSILQIRLLGDTRKTLAQNHFDDPRVSESGLYSEVSWVNRRREPIGTTRMVVMPQELVSIDASANLIPEVGQSVATSQQKAIQRLAQEIVATMESPW